MLYSEERAKTLVIGLDGATFDLIKPWAEQGYLPTLARLMADGAYGNLGSTIPPMTGPAWTSFATGVNPGKHRLYDWIAREPDSYQFVPTTSADATAPTIYALLSQAGQRVVSFNVPMTYPPQPVNGAMISGLPCPTTKVEFTYPATLFDDIVAEIGDYILYPDPGEAYSDSGIDSFLERLYRCAELRMQTLAYLREREDPDFCMMVFNGTDTISHALWKFMDETHPLHTAEGHAKYGTAIRDYYQQIDRYLGEIVDDLDDDTTLIIMSDHGFGPFHKFIHVNNWLIESGFMQIEQGVRARLKHTLFSWGVTPMNVYDKLMQVGFGKLKREVVRGSGQGLMKRLFLSFDDVDWSHTKAYSLGNVGQICLNVQGREPQGCVHPDEYEQVRDEIIGRLWQLRDPETGEQVVEAIYRREEIYHGDQLELAPDIVFMPTRMEYFGFGEFEFGSHKIIEAMKRGISGTHRPNGIFIAYGANVKAGSIVANAHLVDLAPTILHLHQLPIPNHIDGRVLHEAIDNEFDYQPKSVTYHLNGDGENGFGLTQQERDVIAERLRGLGYVG